MTPDRLRLGAATAGLTLVGAGCWWVSPPAALVVVGCVLLAAAVWGHYHATP